MHMPMHRFAFGPKKVAAALALLVATASAGPAFAAPIKVACAGEQTTHSDQLNRSVEYPAMLQTSIGVGWDIQNFGDCCATVLNNYPKQGETHPYILGGGKPSFNESLTYLPDVVVIGSWGKHDTEIANSLTGGKIDPVQFQKDYEAIIAAYMNLSSKPKIYLSTPVPIPKGTAAGPTTDVILPAVNAAAAKYNLPIVDLYTQFLNHPELYKDDTHVSNTDGLKKIADTVQAALTSESLPVDAGADDADTDAGDPIDTDAGSVAPTPPVDSGFKPATGDASANGAQDSGSAGGCSMTGHGGDWESPVFAILVGLGLVAARRRVTLGTRTAGRESRRG